MDDDVKQLKEGMEKYCAFAIHNLFSETQWPSMKVSEIDEAVLFAQPGIHDVHKWSIIEAHYVFPNITDAQREFMANYRWHTHFLSIYIRVNGNPDWPHGGHEQFEKDVQNMEQLSCEARAYYDKHIKGDLLDLQRRYVEQFFLSVDHPK